MLGFLPVLSLTLMLQERGFEKSDFPLVRPGNTNSSKNNAKKSKREQPSDEHRQQSANDSTEPDKYPQWKNVNRALYRGFHSYLRRGYGAPVQSYGGKELPVICFIAVFV